MDSAELPAHSESLPDLLAHAAGEPLALLVKSQNADGGWAFQRDGQSRVEPTCWAIRALTAANSAIDNSAVQRACSFLTARQLPDGSWPASEGMDAGGWMTSLACGVLARFPQAAKAVAAGLQWLCDDYPRDSSAWQRFLKSFRSQKHIVAHNDELRGWGWTPRTSSWVEPTSFALMAFAECHPSAHLAKQIAARRTLARGLLFDRMCPGGGWNCGNPRVYGVDGEALVLPTCWALLALRDAPEHPKRALSLAWLQKEYSSIESAASLAVATITLESYGVRPPAARRTLRDWTASELAVQGTQVLAWVSLALNPTRTWFTLRQAQPTEGPATVSIRSPRHL